MSFIRGVSRNQDSLLPPALDELIEPNSVVRVIDALAEAMDLVALGFVRAEPAQLGRPAYDPRDLLKLYVYGYLHRIRASRALERETKRNIEVMWLLNRLSPDFKTIADFRKDNAQAIVGVCRMLVMFCREQGLLSSTLVAIDGSKFEALASRKRVCTPERIQQELARIDTDVQQYLEQLDSADSQASQQAGDVPAALQAARERAAHWQELARTLTEGEHSHVVEGETEAKLMRTASGSYQVGYNAQFAVEAENHLIVTHTLTSEANDQVQLQPMSEAAREVLQVQTLNVLADTGYYNPAQVDACERAGITAFVPPQTVVNPQGEQYFTAQAFVYHARSNTFRCPAGQILSRVRTDHTRHVQHYTTRACSGCLLKSRCTAGNQRTVKRSFYAFAVERLCARMRAHPECTRMRASLVEHPIGTLKHLLTGARFLVRGKLKAHAELCLAVIAYNLKRLINILGVANLIQLLMNPVHA